MVKNGDDEEHGAGAVMEVKESRRSVVKYLIILLIPTTVIYFFSNYLRWNGYSPQILEQAETTILSNVRVPFDRFPVQIANGSCTIWTLSANTKSPEVPLVMIHGFAAGIAFWVLNIDDVATKRPVYAFDLPGFARSSRPNFSTDALEIESEFIEYIEEWRKIMGLEKMILLGHSFGGFLSSSYTLKYPERVEHLILADPWGFTGRPDLSQIGFFRKSMLKLFENMKPLSIIRAAGPYGEWLVKKARKDILKKYEHIMEDQTVIAQYIQQCNIQNPTGEVAFMNLLDRGPFAKYPIGDRLKENLKNEIPLTFLYGANSWMNNTLGPVIEKSRDAASCYTHIENVKFAGHHVYSDNAVDFNQFVNDACEILKSNRDDGKSTKLDNHII